MYKGVGAKVKGAVITHGGDSDDYSEGLAHVCSYMFFLKFWDSPVDFSSTQGC